MSMCDDDLKRFSGVIPPVIIPLKGDRTLDHEAFKVSIDRMIDAGVTGLFFLGSSGEVVFLTDEQRMEVLQVALEIVDGRVPVLVGIIDMETMRVIDQAKRVSQLPSMPSWQRRPSMPSAAPMRTSATSVRSVSTPTSPSSPMTSRSAFIRSYSPRCSCGWARMVSSKASRTPQETM